LKKEPKKAQKAYLKISNGSAEWVIAQATLFVQKLSRFSVRWRAEEAIIETFFQLLAVRMITWK
jgi:hypothetical protein